MDVQGVIPELLAQTIRSAGRPLHVNVLTRAWLAAQAGGRRYASGSRYRPEETIILDGQQAVVEAVERAENPIQGPFAILILRLPDGTKRLMAAEVPGAPAEDRQPVTDEQVRRILEERGPAIRAAVQEALAADDRFVWFQDAQGDHWCLAEMLPKVGDEEMARAWPMLQGLLADGILRPRPTEALVKAIWGQENDGSNDYLQLVLGAHPGGRIQGNGHAGRPGTLAEGVGIHHVHDHAVVLQLPGHRGVEGQDQLAPVRMPGVHGVDVGPVWGRTAAIEGPITVVVEHQVHVVGDLQGAVGIAAVGHRHQEALPVGVVENPGVGESCQQPGRRPAGADGLRLGRLKPGRHHQVVAGALVGQQLLLLRQPEGQPRGAVAEPRDLLLPHLPGGLGVAIAVQHGQGTMPGQEGGAPGWVRGLRGNRTPGLAEMRAWTRWCRGSSTWR